MSLTTAITLEGQLPEPLQRVIAERGGLSATALQGVGAAAAKAVRENFRSLPGNKLGGKRQFWAGAVKGTSHAVEGGTVTVSTNQIGVRQRLRGGPIVAGANGSGKKFLTIPARSDAYGKTAGDFTGLKFDFTDQGPALVRGSDEFKEVGRKRKDGSRKQVQTGGQGEVVFWLRRRVSQQPNPNVLPSDEVVAEAGIRALMRHFRIAPAGGAA